MVLESAVKGGSADEVEVGLAAVVVKGIVLTTSLLASCSSAEAVRY